MRVSPATAFALISALAAVGTAAPLLDRRSGWTESSLAQAGRLVARSQSLGLVQRGSFLVKRQGGDGPEDDEDEYDDVQGAGTGIDYGNNNTGAEGNGAEDADANSLTDPNANSLTDTDTDTDPNANSLTGPNTNTIDADTEDSFSVTNPAPQSQDPTLQKRDNPADQNPTSANGLIPLSYNGSAVYDSEGDAVFEDAAGSVVDPTGTPEQGTQFYDGQGDPISASALIGGATSETGGSPPTLTVDSANDNDSYTDSDGETPGSETEDAPAGSSESDYAGDVTSQDQGNQSQDNQGQTYSDQTYSDQGSQGNEQSDEYDD